MKGKWLFFALAVHCSSQEPVTLPEAMVYYETSADLSAPASFFSMPYPSDARLLAGKPDLRGFPNTSNLPIVEGLRVTAQQRMGFPTMPVAYFRFDHAMPTLDAKTLIAGSKTSPLLLVDVDPASSERGRLFPVVAATPPPDEYVPENLVAVAPWPGFVLHANRKFAFVVMRSLTDAKGARLGIRPAFADALRSDAFAPLRETLTTLGVNEGDLAAATIFTTGDVVADTASLADAVAKKYSVVITDLAIDPVDGDKHPRFCELHGKVTYPQFQVGKAPYDKDGLFDFSDGGLPAKQRDEDAPIAITLPRTAMPVGGYPLIVYFHGSGGTSTSLVDRGPVKTPTGDFTPGEGPGYVVAAHGFAMAGSALPVNPERVPGAEELAYLNFNNPSAFRDTFRQGVIEQRMFIDALVKLTIDPSIVAACTGMSLPSSETQYHFDTTRLIAQGQSMGGMYTNMISATDPRIKAAVPTGAGGFWSFFVLETKLIPGAAGLLAAVLGTPQKLTFMHPAMHLLETAWEPAEPLVYMPRLARRPLPSHPARPIYEPVGLDDSYFPPIVYDAVALAYGHKEMGTIVWPTMQQSLALDALDGLLPYPVSQNTKSENGSMYTGAIVQYPGDGIFDPHAIYTQLDSVKYQYGCFQATFQKNGVATIPAPAPMGTPCPGL